MTKEVDDSIGFFEEETIDPWNKVASRRMYAHLSLQNLILQPSSRACHIWELKTGKFWEMPCQGLR